MSLRALLFTDVVDSTGWVSRLGDRAAADLWADHDRVARDLLAPRGGREIDRSDGFFLIFDRVDQAVGFAMSYHGAIAPLGLSARVGIHLGEVTLRENPAHDVARGAKPIEVEGLAKPLAARVMSLAAGGQTLLTDAAASELPATGLRQVRGHGHYRLKGIEDPIAIHEVGDESCAWTPPADTEKAYRVVADGDLWKPLREILQNLPAERDAFVGRKAELRTLAGLLAAGPRLVSVLGVGGTGKTRLARRYARAWLGEWPGGAYFCDLSEARSLEGICSAVATALEVPLGREDPAVQLGHAIAARGLCLLILDNFEQVVDHAGATVGRWLDRAGDCRIVVTSRERLQLPGEVLLPLEPLQVASEALELFVARARAHQPGFALDEASRAVVIEIVKVLDGLPLAIELAAARARVLSPAQILARLKDRFSLLSGSRGTAARQATLRSTIDWSWSLLTPWEQAALAQCSVFEGGFTVEAAEAVLDLSAWHDAPAVVDVVQSLTDKSLLRIWLPTSAARLDVAEPYFGMYLSVHDYASLRLQESGRAPDLERRHGEHYATFGTDAAVESLARAGGAHRRHALTLEIDNLVSGCRRAIRRSDAAQAVGLLRAAWEVFFVRGPPITGAELAASVLAMRPLDTRSACTALHVQALALWRSGRPVQAEGLAREALDRACALQDRSFEGRALAALGSILWEAGRMEEAVVPLQAAIDLFETLGDRVSLASALVNLGGIHQRTAEFSKARELVERGIALHREVGDRLHEGTALCNLGGVYFELGRPEAAADALQLALAANREAGDLRGEAASLSNLGGVLGDLGRRDEGRRHIEQALAVHRHVGDRRSECSGLVGLGVILYREGRMKEALEMTEAALVIAREMGNPTYIGATLSNVADLCIELGDHNRADAAITESEERLRHAGSVMDLAKTRATRGLMEVRRGRLDAAQACLRDAEEVAVRIGTTDDSDLGRSVVELREVLRAALQAASPP